MSDDTFQLRKSVDTHVGAIDVTLERSENTLLIRAQHVDTKRDYV